MNDDPGTDATDSSPEQPEKARFGKAQIIATIVTLVVLVLVFAVVFPQFADYEQAWDAIQSMSTGWLIALGIATIVVIVVYVWPYQAALPGLPYRQGFVVRQTSFMISNVIPAGGAIGLGVQFAMLNGYGFSAASSTAAIGITGTWNVFVTLTLPVLALVGLALIGQLNATATLIAIVGVIVVGVGIGLFALILRSEEMARRIGRLGARVVGWLAGLINREVETDLEQAIVDFRDSIIDVVAERWALITGANVLQQLAQFSVLAIAVLALQGGFGGSANLFEVFAAFAFGRLATFSPIPPGGLGTTDAIITAVLTTSGMPDGDALAAVLIWRALTYFPQVFMGVVTFLVWRRQQARQTA